MVSAAHAALINLPLKICKGYHVIKPEGGTERGVNLMTVCAFSLQSLDKTVLESLFGFYAFIVNSHHSLDFLSCLSSTVSKFRVLCVWYQPKKLFIFIYCLYCRTIYAHYSLLHIVVVLHNFTEGAWLGPGFLSEGHIQPGAKKTKIWNVIWFIFILIKLVFNHCKQSEWLKIFLRHNLRHKYKKW